MFEILLVYKQTSKETNNKYMMSDPFLMLISQSTWL